jgi:hypothetical protein
LITAVASLFLMMTMTKITVEVRILGGFDLKAAQRFNLCAAFKFYCLC